MPRDGRDLAELLLRKAETDADTVSTLIAGSTPYQVVGFHAQQSCEKAFKAVLASSGVPYPHTHNLALLVDLLRNAAVLVPACAEQATTLTAFAVFYRYDDFDLADEPIDLASMAALVGEVGRWAAAQLVESAEPSKEGDPADG